ncbi:hypothetical protein FSP39_005429 [Pinctada imbricata]|uniref:PHD-type domain-containing protein n=1 Tax=Pinctada imbricata TaxID=66713 RepID=A0AA88XQH9_PINIB|nr:hypothetical protein FSP39_005429 [Pinctada imbricata]
MNDRQKDIIDQQIKKKIVPQVEVTPVIQSKIRYLAGACIKKISSMLKLDVTNKLYAKTENVRVKRHMSFIKHRLIGSLISSEEESKSSSSAVESFKEIDYKQGPSKGLLNVNDTVFNFFINLHKLVQIHLTASDFHIYLDKLHLHLRTVVFTEEEIFRDWTKLFEDCDDEILHDMFESVCEYFIRISLSEGLHNFKESIPKKKKQALRSKLKALSERSNPVPQSSKQPIQSEESFNCSTCNAFCVWEPTCMDEESIQCDTCDKWYHYKCQQLTGNESFLKRKSSKWSCLDCLE